MKLQPGLGGGFATPDTVAGVVAILASEDGRFVTETEISISTTDDQVSAWPPPVAAARQARSKDSASMTSVNSSPVISSSVDD